MPPKIGHHSGAKPKNAGRTILRVLSYLKEYKFRFAVVLVCLVMYKCVAVVIHYRPLVIET